MEALAEGPAHPPRALRPRPSLGPLGSAVASLVGTFLRVGHTGPTFLESSKFTSWSLKRSYVFPVIAHPETRPPEKNSWMLSEISPDRLGHVT